MKKYLARVLALILTVLPWVSVLAIPRVAKAESALVGPLQPDPQQVTQAHATAPPVPGLSYLEFWQTKISLRVSVEHPISSHQDFVEQIKNLFFLHARLQTDGG